MLPYLRPDFGTLVDLQDTSFSKDLIGRYVCSSIDEVLAAGGRPFDVVVIGAGMFGAYAAEKIYRHGAEQNLRVLVLDAGSYLFSTHVQNLPHIGLNPPDTARVTQNTEDPGTRNGVWGLPWHSNEPFTGLAYCAGGRSVFWGGWSPRLLPNDLARWPKAARDHLNSTYPDVESEIGVVPTADYLSGTLNAKLAAALTKIATTKQQISANATVDDVADAPLAVQASQPGSGLFSFDKYSSVPILLESIRDDINLRWTLNDDSRRRLFLVPRTHVIRLGHTGGHVDRIDLASNGQPVSLYAGQQLSVDAQVVIANGTIESTRLALESFPLQRGSYNMGANFMAHLRTNLTVRVKRTALGLGVATKLQQGGAIVRGEIKNQDGSKRRYHMQVLASEEKGSNPEATMWTMVPDIDLFRNLLANEDPDWVTIVFRGLGEMDGDQLAGPGSPNSFITLTGSDQSQADEFGARRAWVDYTPTTADFDAWRVLAQTGVDLAANLAAKGDVQYLYGGQWNNDPPTDPYNATKDKLGNTHHEAGTLWMGDDPAKSITNTDGKFHHLSNGYVAGPALFPTIGSANPSLTGLTIARKTAAAVVQALEPSAVPDFRPLYMGSLVDWQMAGFGGFMQVFDILESTDGPGLLWYTRQAFSDFVLQLDWQYANRTDNSGIFIRFPSLDSSDPKTNVDRAINGGYEIQIDPRGYNSEKNVENDPLRSTGAIYNIQAPTKLNVARGPWQWNTYVIEAIGPRIRVTLNGELINDFTDPNPRSGRGHIGLQNHHRGSKVQFRNIQIKSVLGLPATTTPAVSHPQRREKHAP